MKIFIYIVPVIAVSIAVFIILGIRHLALLHYGLESRMPDYITAASLIPLGGLTMRFIFIICAGIIKKKEKEDTDVKEINKNG